jgi:molybdate transport system substrate-binding protein
VSEGRHPARLAWLPLIAIGCTGNPDRPVLRVLAAASLSGVFMELEQRFTTTHPGVQVELVFAGTQTLATQLRHGLQADTLASADPHIADALLADGLLGTPEPFATGTLVLAVPATASSPRELADLTAAERLVLGTPEVPVGRYADALLDDAAARYGADWHAAVQTRVVSREPDARKVAAKVALGEADAAIVYASDLRGLEGVRAVPLPPGLGPTPTYVQGPLRDAPSPALAAAWMQLVRSDAGHRALLERGLHPVDP